MEVCRLRVKDVDLERQQRASPSDYRDALRPSVGGFGEVGRPVPSARSGDLRRARGREACAEYGESPPRSHAPAWERNVQPLCGE